MRWNRESGLEQLYEAEEWSSSFRVFWVGDDVSAIIEGRPGDFGVAYTVYNNTAWIQPDGTATIMALETRRFLHTDDVFAIMTDAAVGMKVCAGARADLK